MVRIAEESFPDNKGLKWTIHGYRHQRNLTYVEVEPRPSEIGYPRFQFVVSFENFEKPVVIGCYCLDNGRWTLLFTKPDLKEPLPSELGFPDGVCTQ